MQEVKKTKIENLTKTWYYMQNCTYIAIDTIDNNFNIKLFYPRVAYIIKKSSIKIKLPENMWYLDICTFKHFINNKNLFINNFYLKYLNFTIAKSQILQL